MSSGYQTIDVSNPAPNLEIIQEILLLQKCHNESTSVIRFNFVTILQMCPSNMSRISRSFFNIYESNFYFFC